MNDRTVELDLLWLGQSTGAIRVSEDEGSEIVWLPKGAISYRRTFVRGPNGIEDRVVVEGDEQLFVDKGLL